MNSGVNMSKYIIIIPRVDNLGPTSIKYLVSRHLTINVRKINVTK